MPFFMQCPYCRNKFSLPYSVMVTACPNCMKSFPVDHLDKAFTWEPTSPPAVAGAEDSKPVSRTAPAAELPEPFPISRGTSAPPATGRDHVEDAPRTVPPSAVPKP